MKHTVFALALALLAGCAAPNAYSGTTRSSEETNKPPAAESSSGSGAAEPEYKNPGAVFSTDEYQDQIREFEAWEAGGG